MKQQMEGTHLHLVLAPDSPFINPLLWGGFSLGVLAFSLRTKLTGRIDAEQAAQLQREESGRAERISGIVHAPAKWSSDPWLRRTHGLEECVFLCSNLPKNR